MKLSPTVLQRCGFLAGPTAAGKSELSLMLAERIGAEILSMDSMAIYRRMDIGTAKPTPQDRARVPHHLVDLIEPDEEFSTAAYLEAAQAAAEEVLARGRVPIFVGGTGLYLRALLRGIFEGPPADWEYRRQLEAEAQANPDDWLWQQLFQVDPVTAKRLHPHDARRLIRALEIHRHMGIPASSLQQETPLPEADRPAFVVWLHPSREVLYEQINQRVDRMFAAGLVEEVRQLLASAHPPGRTAAQALGYREVIDWLQERAGSLEETQELIKTRTRQFAKRQHTWFRNLEECRELPLVPGESPVTLCARLLTMARADFC